MTADLILDFVQRLCERQSELLAKLPATSALAATLSRLMPSLTLTKAALEKQQLIQAHPDLPLQIAVVGPTQAGKSSLVNLIVGQAAAEVSPLAGFTTHLQAFLYDVETQRAVPLLEEFFPDFQRFELKELPRERFDCFGVASVMAIHKSPLPSCVVWDTPDFDSIRSQQYLGSVLRIAALADLLVLVVSKDKYADQAVWDFLSLVEGLGQPALVCLNKIRPGTQEILRQSWEEKWRRVRKDPCPPLLTLEYCPHPGDVEVQRAVPLLEACVPLLRTARDRRRQTQVTKLVRRYWSMWTAPIRAELEAQERFKAMVEAALDLALSTYRRDFLDHPVGYETLQRTLAELLVLLEIPGLKRPMMAVRRALTWPIKSLFARSANVDLKSTPTTELLILRRSVEHALLQLLAQISDQAHSQETTAYWWQETACRYHASYPALLRLFEVEALNYYHTFAPRVEEAAKSLYQRLKQMPATLNSLRAARACTDAAGLALLFHTGGIGPHDFVLAPAMLSLTSWLAESALGKYIESIARDLKRSQLQEVRTLLENKLGEKIAALGEHQGRRTCLGIPKSALAKVEAELNERPYGLKLFSI